MADSLTNKVTVLLSTSSGAFTNTSFILPGQPGPISLVTSDFNGDGIADLAASSGSALTFFYGHGSGTFRAGKTITLPLTAPVLALSAGTFHLGGGIGVAVANADAILLVENSGLISAPVSVPNFRSFAVADLNTDGAADLVVLQNTSQQVAIYLNNGAGDFFLPNSFYPTGAAYPISATAGRFRR